MPLLSTLSYSALSGLGSFYLGTAVKGRRLEQEAEQFRDEILAEINERYEAYLELEARISRAIKQFDLEEDRSAREIARREERILELERALECSVDQNHAGGGESGMLAEIEGALDAIGSDDTQGIEDPGVRGELERELAELRAELMRTRDAKDAEIGRQEEMITSLSACVASLEAELESAAGQAVAVSAPPALGEGFGEGSGEAEGGANPPDASGEDERLLEAQRELETLRTRLEELSPYVQRLADAQERVDGLEQRCEELRAARESAVIGLQARLAELEAERDSQAEKARERDQLEARVAELAPSLELLAETRFRVRELEEECDEVRRTREDDVFALQSRVAELEAQSAQGAEDHAARGELEERVAELTPFVDRLATAQARILELEVECSEARRAREEDVFALQARVAELEASHAHAPAHEELARQLEEAREQLADSQSQLVDSQQLLSESHGELAETKRELGEAEDKALKLEQRCETIRRKKDEQIEVLRGRIAELGVLREELQDKEAALGELEERCTSLERSKKRAATTMRKLREDLADTEDMVREVGGDPEVLRREREERRELIYSVFDELDEVLEGMKGQERRLASLDKVHDQSLREQEREITGLEARVHDLYLLLETAEDVITKLEARN